MRLFYGCKRGVESDEGGVKFIWGELVYSVSSTYLVTGWDIGVTFWTLGN